MVQNNKYLWLPALSCYGIQDVSILKHIGILHGTGVGGGSLVYANQLLVPPDEVFIRPEWCIRSCKSALMPHYATARKMLGANPSLTITALSEYIMSQVPSQSAVV